MSKIYYTHGFIRDRMVLFSDEFARHGQESPFAEWLSKWDPSRGDLMGRVTPRWNAPSTSHSVTMRCGPMRRRSTPNGMFFAVPLEWQQRLWPTEEFELAKTRVKTALPETDLFAGIEA